MHIRYGYDIEIVCEQDVPAILMLDVHPDRRADISQPDELVATSLSTGAPCPKSPRATCSARHFERL